MIVDDNAALQTLPASIKELYIRTYSANNTDDIRTRSYKNADIIPRYPQLHNCEHNLTTDLYVSANIVR